MAADFEKHGARRAGSRITIGPESVIVTWEGLALLLGWWLTTVAGVAWIERRLSKMESSIAMLIQVEQRRERMGDSKNVDQTTAT